MPQFARQLGHIELEVIIVRRFVDLLYHLTLKEFGATVETLYNARYGTWIMALAFH